jgi:hypothetical protein
MFEMLLFAVPGFMSGLINVIATGRISMEK